MNVNTKKIAFLSIMLALMFTLAAIEIILPPFPMLPPQFGRIGLPNVIVMYILFFVGRKEAIVMAILKAMFSILMRGPTAGLLSLSGGLLSVGLIIILWWVFRDRISYVALSIAGAIGHNVGQLIVACFMMQNWRLLGFYFPILLITGTIFGTVTGIFLRMFMLRFDLKHRGW